MRVAIVTNPSSTRNRREGIGAITALAAARGLDHHVLTPDNPLDAIVARLAPTGAGLVVVAAGDGTFQGLITEVLERRERFRSLPYLCHMARGDANMTARDCGLAGGAASDLAALLDRLDEDGLAAHAVERALLRLDYADGKRAERGLFLGLGGIVDGIGLFKAGAKGRGGAKFGHARTIVRLLAKSARRGPEAAGIGPHPVAVALDGGPVRRASLLLALATTLERLMYGFRPFWGPGGAGTFRWTEIDANAPKLLRHAAPVLYGRPYDREDRRLPEGYRSSAPWGLTIETAGPFALDGELFHPVPGRAARLSAAERLVFVRG